MTNNKRVEEKRVTSKPGCPKIDTELSDVVKSSTMFFTAVAIYFTVLYLEDAHNFFLPSYVKALFKCGPILYLILFLWYEYESVHHLRENHAAVNIFIGLVFSLIGDVLLIRFDVLFILGLICFAAAHIFYTIAFGFDHLRPQIFLFWGAIGFLSGWRFVSYAHADMYYKVVISVSVYLPIITVMVWRACSNFNKNECWEGNWSTLLSAVGAILFFISDELIGNLIFVSDFSESSYWIISTYYVGQYMIATSVKLRPKIIKKPDFANFFYAQ